MEFVSPAQYSKSNQAHFTINSRAAADLLRLHGGLGPEDRSGCRLCPHWSSSVIAALSLVESFTIVMLDNAVLCHKEPAHGTQSPLLGASLAFRCFFMA